MIALTEDKRMLGYGVMTPYSNIFCFATTRRGGFSKGDYASFNCTPYTGDDAESVIQQSGIAVQLPYLNSLKTSPPTDTWYKGGGD